MATKQLCFRPLVLCISFFVLLLSMLACEQTPEKTIRPDLLTALRSSSWCMEEAGSEECFRIVGNKMIVSANGLDKNVLQVYLTKINDSIVEMFFVGPEKNKRLIQQIAPDSLAVRTNKKGAISTLYYRSNR
jgi:hypothetical protein